MSTNIRCRKCISWQLQLIVGPAMIQITGYDNMDYKYRNGYQKYKRYAVYEGRVPRCQVYLVLGYTWKRSNHTIATLLPLPDQVVLTFTARSSLAGIAWKKLQMTKWCDCLNQHEVMLSNANIAFAIFAKKPCILFNNNPSLWQIQNFPDGGAPTP